MCSLYRKYECENCGKYPKIIYVIRLKNLRFICFRCYLENKQYQKIESRLDNEDQFTKHDI